RFAVPLGVACAPPPDRGTPPRLVRCPGTRRATAAAHRRIRALDRGVDQPAPARAPRRRQRRAGTTARPGGHAGSARRSERGRRHHASSFRADALHHARTVAVARERPWSRDQRERHRGPGPLGRRRRRLLSDATPGPLRYAGGPASWRRPLVLLVD